MNRSDNDSTDFCTVLEIVYNPEVSLNDYQHLVPHFLHSSWTSLGDIPSNLALYGKAEVLEYLNFFHRNLEQTPADWHTLSMMLSQGPRSDEESHQDLLYYLCLALYEIHIAIESSQRIDQSKDYSVSQANGIIQAFQALIRALFVSEPMDIIERRSAWDFGKKTAQQKFNDDKRRYAKSRTELPKPYWSAFDRVVQLAVSKDKLKILRVTDLADILRDFFFVRDSSVLGFKWHDSYAIEHEWFRNNLKDRLKLQPHEIYRTAQYLSKGGKPRPKLERENLAHDIAQAASNAISSS